MSLEKPTQDKMMKTGDAETKDVPEVKNFFMPGYGFTVQATSLAEAMTIAEARKASDNK